MNVFSPKFDRMDLRTQFDDASNSDRSESDLDFECALENEMRAFDRGETDVSPRHSERITQQPLRFQVQRHSVDDINGPAFKRAAAPVQFKILSDMVMVEISHLDRNYKSIVDELICLKKQILCMWTCSMDVLNHCKRCSFVSVQRRHEIEEMSWRYKIFV